MGTKNISMISTPDLSGKPLLADVQAYELYASKAFNRKFRGVLKQGAYQGFEVAPGTGLKVVVSSDAVDGNGGAIINVSDEYLITVQQQADVTLTVPAGQRSAVVLTATFDGNTITDQVDADSLVAATELLVVPTGSRPDNSILLMEIDVPSNATQIDESMFIADNADRIIIDGYWRKRLDGDIEPKGQWLRTIVGKGLKPAAAAVRAAATDFLGNSTAWFKEAWVNTYRGGSIDVEGGIKSGGVEVLKKGDFGVGGKAIELPNDYDLNNLDGESGLYRGYHLKNAPSSDGFYFVRVVVHSSSHLIQEAFRYGSGTTAPAAYRRVREATDNWTAWERDYSPSNKPTASDVDAFSKSESDGRFLAKLANAVSATKLKVARTLSLSGDATGSASFDGSSNANIAVSVKDDSHAHTHKTVTGAGNFDGGVGRVILPKGGEYKEQGANTGAIKIRLPVGWTSTMMRLRVEIYDYAQDESFTMWISGYNYAGDNAWHQMTATQVGNRHALPVRWGHDGTYCCVLIGDTTQTWSYLAVHVAEVQVSQTISDVNQWASGWDVSRVTAYPSNIDRTQQATLLKAETANRLATARTIALGGDLSGSANFDGAGNITINATVGNDSHTHDSRYPRISANAVITGLYNFNTSNGTKPHRLSRYGGSSSEYTDMWVADTATMFHHHEDEALYPWYIFKGNGTGVAATPVDYLSLSKDTALFSGAVKLPARSDALYLGSGDKDVGQVGMTFRGHTDQFGHFYANHQNAASQGGGYSFHFASTEEITNVILDGGGNFKVGAHEVYHEGHKPSPAEIGALAAFGVRHQGHGSAILTNSIVPWDVSHANDEPAGAVDGTLTTTMWDANTYGCQQYHDFHSNSLHIRQRNNGAWGAWAKLVRYGDNIGSGATNYAAGNHSHPYLPLAGGTLTGNLGVHGTSPTITATCSDAGQAVIQAIGTNQGTGILYAGQSTSYGGGIGYDGDDTPNWVGGADRIALFRRKAGTDYVVADWHVNDGIFDFKARPTINGNQIARLADNVASASKLATARNIALGGDLSGSANFDGSGNISITATVKDSSHNHDFNNISGQYGTSRNVDTYSQNNFWSTYISTATNMGAKPGNYYYIANLGGNGGAMGLQLAATFGSGHGLYYRARSDSSSAENGANKWKNWKKIYHSGAKPTPAEIGAAPSSHNHDSAYLAKGGTAVNATKLGNKANSQSATSNTIAERDGSGDVHARLFRSNYQNETRMTGAVAFRVNTSDNYTRWCSSTSAFRGWLGVMDTAGYDGRYLGKTAKAANSAKADWADQVDVNTSSSTSQYNFMWHSGDTAYSTNGKIKFRPSDGWAEFFGPVSIRRDLTIGGGSAYNSWLTIHGADGSTERTGMSIGESGKWGSASLHIYYTGDGNAHIGMGSMNASGHAAYRAMQFHYQNNSVSFLGTTSHAGRIYANGGMQLGSSDTLRFHGGGTYYLREATGSYGSVAAYGRKGGWSGYSIEGRAVFMHDGGNATGIYNDVNNRWLFLAYHDGDSIMYSAGNEKIRARSAGALVQGELEATTRVEAPTVRVSNDTDTYMSSAGVFDDGQRCWSNNNKPSLATLGAADNSPFDTSKMTLLYSSSSGATGSVTLSQSYNNFRALVVMGMKDSWHGWYILPTDAFAEANAKGHDLMLYQVGSAYWRIDLSNSNTTFLDNYNRSGVVYKVWGFK